MSKPLHFIMRRVASSNNTSSMAARTMAAQCSPVATAVSENSISPRRRAPQRYQSTVTGKDRYSSLRVDQQRLMDSIHHTCQWGTGERWGEAPTETGMSRLSLSDTDKLARDWFASTTESLGCKVTVDEMGNQFAIRKGKRDGPPTVAGSHLDTQPTGGRYDGILGVTAAVEMLRVLHENEVETEFAVGAVNWTNEEGARFPISMVSSGVWAGSIPVSTAHNLPSVVRSDPKNTTMRSELERIGYLGTAPCSHTSTPLAAHFELHIEQGPILENENRKIGVVQGVQAYRWYTITVKGKDCHTGATDLLSRSDALLAAAKMIVAAREVAYKRGARVSTGIIDAQPGSVNTVPGTVSFSLDIRSFKENIVHETEDELKAVFETIASGKGTDSDDGPAFLTALTPSAHPDTTTVTWRQDFDSPTVKFHADTISCVNSAAGDVFGDQKDELTRDMFSGAGHDSVYTSKRCPTSMIFVPSRGGVSHNPVEFTEEGDCAVGAQVLMGSVLRYDRLRAERGV